MDETITPSESEVTTSKPKGGKGKKIAIILSLIATVAVLGGLIAALLLIPKEQDIREEAAVSGGIAKVFITPETKTINAGESFQANILFDTAGIAMSAITVQLEYLYEGDIPSMTATTIQTSSALVTDELWAFPVQSISEEDGKGVIKIAGFSGSVSGYQTSGQEVLATVTFQGITPGSITTSFDASSSIITSKENENDVLLIPQSVATYTTSGATNTPTQAPTVSPTTPISYPTSTPISQGGTQVGAPTSSPSAIPVTGLSTPTIMSLSLGAILILASFMVFI